MKIHRRTKQRNMIIKWGFKAGPGARPFFWHIKTYGTTSDEVNNTLRKNKKTLQKSTGSFYIPLKDRRQRERRNRRKNLWGNVSLLRGWQQHPRIDVVTFIITIFQKLIRPFLKF